VELNNVTQEMYFLLKFNLLFIKCMLFILKLLTEMEWIDLRFDLHGN